MVAVIEARALRKDFDEVKAVDGIDFTIEQGECFGFLGPNGAGKSTTMRMIFCASPITSGELRVLGLDVTKDQREIKRLIGVAPQGDNLDPDFTTKKNLLVYARYFGMGKEEADKKADDLLAFMQLTEKADARIEELSGGMKRRLIIARALLNDPRVLILDEPTTGLDPQARHLIWDRVRELKAKGVTVIITTHYMDEAERLCDRLVIMDKGQIMVEGKPLELIAKFMEGGIVEVESVSREVEDYIILSSHRYEVQGDRILVFTNDGDRLVAELNSKFRIPKLYVRRPTLEDVFLKLTGRRLVE
jgi:lipooligosaccharide transport system ATP-binding protein